MHHVLQNLIYGWSLWQMPRVSVITITYFIMWMTYLLYPRLPDPSSLGSVNILSWKRALLVHLQTIKVPSFAWPDFPTTFLPGVWPLNSMCKRLWNVVINTLIKISKESTSCLGRHPTPFLWTMIHVKTCPQSVLLTKNRIFNHLLELWDGWLKLDASTLRLRYYFFHRTW